jgi:hypothetical protein
MNGLASDKNLGHQRKKKAELYSSNGILKHTGPKPKKISISRERAFTAS